MSKFVINNGHRIARTPPSKIKTNPFGDSTYICGITGSGKTRLRTDAIIVTQNGSAPVRPESTNEKN